MEIDDYLETIGDLEYELSQLREEKKLIKSKKEKSKNKNTTNPDGSPITAEDLMRFESNKIPREYLYPNKKIEDKSNYFYGKKVVITGEFNKFPYRGEMAQWLWEVGADVDTTVSERTDAVICGENAGPSKMDKIIDFGIEEISEIEFLAYFKDKKPKYV